MGLIGLFGCCCRLLRRAARARRRRRRAVAGRPARRCARERGRAIGGAAAPGARCAAGVGCGLGCVLITGALGVTDALLGRWIARRRVALAGVGRAGGLGMWAGGVQACSRRFLDGRAQRVIGQRSLAVRGRSRRTRSLSVPSHLALSPRHGSRMLPRPTPCGTRARSSCAPRARSLDSTRFLRCTCVWTIAAAHVSSSYSVADCGRRARLRDPRAAARRATEPANRSSSSRRTPVMELL